MPCKPRNKEAGAQILFEGLPDGRPKRFPMHLQIDLDDLEQDENIAPLAPSGGHLDLRRDFKASNASSYSSVCFSRTQA